ncbi:MAG TPA: polymer-forming cytoskeletal protein [Crocinitomicaceae bacterium]|nr:polymer-forming cytoskeletal protein [Crocinitomicaceae bacterium]
MRKKGNELASNPDRLNVIVEGSKVMGDMITESNLRIDGEVIGNVSSAAKVVVGKTGIIKGNLTCAEADVEGKIEGVIKTDALLILRSSANIEGEITTGKFQVEEGAEFSGTCTMSNFSNQKNSSVAVSDSGDLVY